MCGIAKCGVTLAFSGYVTQYLNESLRVDAKRIICRLTSSHQNWIAIMRSELVDRALHHFIFFESIRLLNSPLALLVPRTKLAHRAHKRKKNCRRNPFD